MKTFFSVPRKINLQCTVNKFSGSPTVLKNVLNKKHKIKHIAYAKILYKKTKTKQKQKKRKDHKRD